MTCRYDSDDPRKCDRCGAFLWVAEEGLFCGECGVTMPCTMQVRPAGLTAPNPSRAEPNPRRSDGRRGQFDQSNL